MVHATADRRGSDGGVCASAWSAAAANAFIGAVHRMAMRLDDLVELTAGALSADAENARALRRRSRPRRRPRLLRTIARWRRSEAARPDGIEAVVIVTPNHLHYPVAKAFLEAGIDVICDKPLSATLAEAKELVELAAAQRPRLRGDAQQHRLSDGAAGARNGRGGRRSATLRVVHARLYPGLADPSDRRRRAEAGGMAHRSRARRRLGRVSPTSASTRTISRFRHRARRSTRSRRT